MFKRPKQISRRLALKACLTDLDVPCSIAEFYQMTRLARLAACHTLIMLDSVMDVPITALTNDPVLGPVVRGTPTVLVPAAAPVRFGPKH